MKYVLLSRLWLGLLVLALPIGVAAEPALTLFNIETGEDGQQSYTMSLQILALMTLLTLLPAILLTMTSFTRIIIVFSILRQALGMAQTPSNQILLGLSLFLALFIMRPVFNEVNQVALQPYLNGQLEPQLAIEKAQVPIKAFMLGQTREQDLNLFVSLSDDKVYEEAEDVPFFVVLPAFVTSELKTAFQIGFLLFIPFLIIDLVVASLLMAMGMVMLSPMIISLPFKIMLFVLVDGWVLIVGTLAESFGL